MRPAELREVRPGFPAVFHCLRCDSQGFGAGSSAEVRALRGRAREG